MSVARSWRCVVELFMDLLRNYGRTSSSNTMLVPLICYILRLDPKVFQSSPKDSVRAARLLWEPSALQEPYGICRSHMAHAGPYHPLQVPYDGRILVTYSGHVAKQSLLGPYGPLQKPNLFEVLGCYYFGL